MFSTSPLDWGLVLLYFGFLAAVWLRRLGRHSTAVEYLVAGRRVTLPAFVATLVATWYGGILGVGEYSYRYGISNWLVFGVPYYAGALLFAIFYARRAMPGSRAAKARCQKPGSTSVESAMKYHTNTAAGGLPPCHWKCVAGRWVAR